MPQGQAQAPAADDEHQGPTRGVYQRSPPASTSVLEVSRPEPLPDQWYSRDLLVLHEVACAFANDPQATPEASDIAKALDLDEDLVGIIGESLKEAGYVDGITTSSDGIIIFTKLTPAGRREVGLWPSPETAADRLLAALQAAVDNAPTEEAKSKARRALDAVVSAGRDFAIDVASGVVTGQISG
jgi:DNA-binding MarR family transcriptional regulator